MIEWWEFNGLVAKIAADDRLIIIGTRKKLAELETAFEGKESQP